MKRTYLTLIVAMLVVGFAAVTTNLVINGTINFGFNQNDFDSNVVFTYTNTMNGAATIKDNGKSITFKTTKLEDVEQEAIMDFDIANKSKQYDANVTIECGLEEKDKTYEDYLDIKYNLENSTFKIESGDTKSIRLTITLTKAYNESLEKDIDMLCTIKATPEERDTEGTYTPKEHEYEEILLNGADPVLEATPVEGISLTAQTNEKKLIPVIIDDDGKVTRADTTKEWYDYESQQWANAVILADGVEDPGANKEISEDDIESYFVWIPKYSYQLWDLGKYEGVTKVDEHKVHTIPIRFGITDTNDENPNECTTPLTEDKKQGKSGDSGNCDIGEWMTHPAFTSFGVNGFWVGKFETGYRGAQSKTDARINTVNKDKIIIKPNVYSWSGINASNAYENSYNYNRKLDSHLMKNTEWGAVAYLSHSKYGKYTLDEGNTEIMLNNSNNFVTGYSAKLIPTEGFTLYEGCVDSIPGRNDENGYNYNDRNSAAASTTGNYSGIYDMNGGNSEIMMATMQSESGNPSYINSGFTADNFPKDLKYYDIYKYSNNYKYNIGILGDATSEMGPFETKTYGSNTAPITSWYIDFGWIINSTAPWFIRGGSSDAGTGSGITFFTRGDGGINNAYRIVLAPTN